ncbi:hypothetical protein LOTGIDRAFT_167105 [Lottia gigantea]|uniref:Purple acid phosphatase n=1 Tax=Lottia gigantea TaxID=225164 RepID=V4A001_LOTGI|nr:hypothetical protein LOTGIDRAFT_167105 [Lottia gigantea]ESO86581.1 hypothetical protein LOTGIDRAFT_167105 [Lottia gigantea]
MKLKVKCLPEKVHINYGNNIGEMIIMWTTPDDCSTIVRFDTSPWNFQYQASGSSLNIEQINQSSAKYIHRVILQNLEGDKTYFYRPISNDVSTGPFYFKTKPITKDWIPKFLIHSTINTDILSYINNQVLTGDITALFSTHNYNYDNQNIKYNDEIVKMVEGITTKIPYLLSPSNQEKLSDIFTEYRHEFSMPGTDWPIPMNKLWYSIDIGPIHFISYSTEVFFTSNKNYRQEQRDWLIADLKQANTKRTERPWVIALGHRPMYCTNITNSDCSTTDSTVRAGFEDIFYTYGVDIVLQSHEPLYERLWPTYKDVVLSDNYTNPMAPIQITVGPTVDTNIDNNDNNTEEWSAFHLTNGTKSIGSLQVINETHIQYDQITADSKVLDTFWIVQENHGPFQREKLPEKVEEKIEETIKKNGEKPVYADKNTENEKDNLYETDKHQRIYIGVAFGCLFVVIVVFIVVIRSCRRKQRTSRRWESMDFNYTKKFYSTPKANGSSKMIDDDTDFEIDMTDGNLATTKLLDD